MRLYSFVRVSHPPPPQPQTLRIVRLRYSQRLRCRPRLRCVVPCCLAQSSAALSCVVWLSVPACIVLRCCSRTPACGGAACPWCALVRRWRAGSTSALQGTSLWRPARLLLFTSFNFMRRHRQAGLWWWWWWSSGLPRGAYWRLGCHHFQRSAGRIPLPLPLCLGCTITVCGDALCQCMWLCL